MRWPLLVTTLVLSVLATAWAQTATAQVSAPRSSDDAAAASSGSGAQPFSAPSWQRPIDVAPLAAEGKFDVISNTPWPGEKVRVFFFGVQG